jgi:hypothetical protein
MKKETLVAQLEAAKTLSSTVDIDKVISLINQIESETKIGLTQELADEIANRIERCLDRNCDDLVDKEAVTFEIVYGNQLEIDEAHIDVSTTMEHITACLEEFVVEEDEVVDENETGHTLPGFEEGIGLDNLNIRLQEDRQGI